MQRPSIAASTSASGRHRRSEPDDGVARVVAVRIRGAGRGDGDSRRLRQLDRARRRALGRLERHEVAALRVRPSGVPGQPVGQDPLDRRELRGDELSVGAHVLAHPLGVAEEAQVALLVELVGSDRLHGAVLAVPVEVGRGCGEEGDSGPGVRDLRRRAEHERAIRVACLGRDPEDVDRRRLVVGEVMDGVGVVPEQPEVGRGSRQRNELARGRLVERDTGRVRVHRHDPHAAHGRVAEVGRDRRNVEPAVRGRRHGDHPDAERLQDREVAVVAGNRAEEGDVVIPPGALRPGNPVQQGVRDDVVHEAEARVVAGEQLRPPGRRAVRRRARGARGCRRSRRSCADPCRTRRGSREPRSMLSSCDERSSCSGDGLPRVRSSASPRAFSSSYWACRAVVGRTCLQAIRWPGAAAAGGRCAPAAGRLSRATPRGRRTSAAPRRAPDRASPRWLAPGSRPGR